MSNRGAAEGEKTKTRVRFQWSDPEARKVMNEELGLKAYSEGLKPTSRI